MNRVDLCHCPLNACYLISKQSSSFALDKQPQIQLYSIYQIIVRCLHLSPSYLMTTFFLPSSTSPPGSPHFFPISRYRVILFPFPFFVRNMQLHGFCTSSIKMFCRTTIFVANSENDSNNISYLINIANRIIEIKLLTIYLQMAQMHPSVVASRFQGLDLLQIYDSVLK